MSNALLQAGAVPKGNTNWAPIFSNEFFSGLFTNRNPLRDPATPFLYGKFYSATRYEAIWDGLNTEITPRLTLARAPGHSVYNSKIFPATNDYYSYHVVGVNFNEYIRVVCDTASAVYDCTAGTKALIYTKSGAAGQCRFIAIGNTLYMGDGVSLLKYISPSYVWESQYAMPSGAFIVDTNSNIQECLGYGIACTNVNITNSVVTLTVPPLSVSIPEGTNITLQGMLTGYLNGLSLYTSATANIGSTSITASYASPDLNEIETGIRGSSSGFVTIPTINGSLGYTEPTWNSTWGGYTLDNNILWQQDGPQLRIWGAPAPTTAPNVANVINTQVTSEWNPNTYYLANSPVVFITANSGANIGINYLYQLAAVSGDFGVTGTYASESYTGTTGEVITDGTTTCTCLGPASRQLLTPYSAGTIILVTFTISYNVQVPNPNYHGGVPQPGGPQPTMQQTISTTYSQFYQCTTPGITSGNPDSDQTYFEWNTGIGGSVTDGTVVWTNISPAVQRFTTPIGAPPNNSTPPGPPVQTAPYTYVQAVGVIGDSANVADVTSVITAAASANGATEGTVEIVVSPGISSNLILPAEPNWTSAEGSITIDGSVDWSNNGNSPATGGTAGGFVWEYSYAYVDEITGAVGPSSPVTLPITLGADSYIQVQGSMSSLVSVGSIIIYRTTTGGAQPFYIAQIDNDITKKTWTYNDFSPDEGSIGSTMNNLIEADLIGYNNPPPSGFLPIALHLTAIWGFVNNILYYSAGGGVVDMEGGWEAFPAGQYAEFQSKGITGWDTNNGLYVLLTDSLQLVSGTSAPFNISQIVPIGIQSPNCFTLNGQSPFIYTSDKQVIGFDPSAGIAVDGWPIANILAKPPFTPLTTHISWYVNGTDQRLFVSDGSTGYYNMINSISPEAPTAVWSPKREIIGGCSAVKAVETSPGNYQLLVGPGTKGGPILYRDITSATDNGQEYNAWAIFGSNVLCHPGQVAEIGFVHIEAPRYGIAPQVAVLLDEISGYPNCTQFLLLPYTETDPIRLDEPASIYSNRHYLSQTEEPQWCRHLQIQISFGKSSILDEVLTFSIYGAIHLERSEAGR